MSRRAIARTLSLTLLLGALAVPAIAQPKPGSVDQEIPAGPIGEDDAASTRVDRERPGDDDIDLEDEVAIDLDGIAINAGIQWRF